MTVTTSTADKVLKTAYLDVVSEYLNYGVNPFLAKIKKTSDNVWGKEIKKLVRMGYNNGVSAGTEDGVLPTADGQTYKEFTINLKNLYGTIEISDKAIRASQNKSGAFTNLLNDEIESLMNSANYNFSRMLFGDGNGTVGVIEIMGENAYKVTNLSNFKVGMKVMIYSKNQKGYIENGRIYTVTRTDEESQAISFDVSAEVDPDDVIVYPNAYGNELTGLKAIFDSSVTTLYGLKKSNNKDILPHVVENAGEISEMLIQRAIDNVEDTCGGKINFILCSSGVKRALIEHMSTYRRNLDMLELKGGYKTISFNGIPVVSDRFCPEGTMYLLNTDDFAIHQLCDWEWIEGDDGKILKQLNDKPVYRATLVKYAELLCSRPWAQIMISGITEA
ncbi:MAG: phage major capsid protein [Clostridia bacterium]|nr:phage major capsid protein [Clostridia bacterium]